MGRGELLIEVKNFNAWYAKNRALRDVSFEVPKNSIYAFIGPSGCGKTTMLRSLNRLNDLVGGFKCEGTVKIGGADIYARHDRKFVENLRKSIGMIFQQPNPLPITIMQNMLLPINEHYTASKTRLKEIAVENLTMAAIYDEVADKLDKPALSLSGGQQQRLCIARVLALEPEVILLDRPCSGLDPISTANIENSLEDLKKRFTIILAPHNVQQAARISDRVAFMLMGRLIEEGTKTELFSNPRDQRTSDYITGRFG